MRSAQVPCKVDSARPVGGRIGEVPMQGVVVVAVLVALGVISAITLAAVHELAKQNGRLLLRLDELERRLGPDLSSKNGSAPARHLLPTLTTLTESRIERNGLRAGAS